MEPRRAKTTGRKLNKLDWKDALEGTVIAYSGDYINPMGQLYQNYTIKCKRHDDCHKTLGRGPQNLSRFGGELGVLAALHSWLDIPDDPDRTHAQQHPQRGPSLAYLEAHRAELDVLFDILTGSP